MLATVTMSHAAMLRIISHVHLAMCSLVIAIVREHINRGNSRLHGGKHHHHSQQPDQQIVIIVTSHRFRTRFTLLATKYCTLSYLCQFIVGIFIQKGMIPTVMP